MGRPSFTAWVAVLAAWGLLVCLGACAPQGQAVGRTGEVNGVAHDGIDRNDMTVGLIGGADGRMAVDAAIMDACAGQGIEASYAAVWSAASYDQAVWRSMEDLAERRVSLIAVSALTLRDGAALSDGWRRAFASAREAGIPVVLIDPIDVPDDDTLFAAVFTTASPQRPSTLAIAEAFMLVADDRPHPIRMPVRIGP